MNILIITQTVDEKDPILGFFCDWLLEFSKFYSKVTVIALGVGDYAQPENVEVFSLGKNDGKNRAVYLFRFFKLIIEKRKDYDLVFVHMNPIYLVLAGWYWQLLGKKVFLWYTHRQVDLKLRLGAFFAKKIFTASAEGLCLKTGKKTVLGHGINSGRFFCPEKIIPAEKEFSVLHVGRIAPIKNISVLIEAVAALAKRGVPVILTLVGPAKTDAEKKEKKHLEEIIEKNNLKEKVSFAGPVSFNSLPCFFCQARVSVNLAPTGGMDKAVLESLFCGTPAIASNKTFLPVLEPYAETLSFKEGDYLDLALKLERFFKMEESKKMEMAEALRIKVQKGHNLSNLIEKIYKYGLE
jgi:glycosyltransferase involved in cell wall biosynthesis